MHLLSHGAPPGQFCLKSKLRQVFEVQKPGASWRCFAGLVAPRFPSQGVGNVGNRQHVQAGAIAWENLWPMVAAHRIHHRAGKSPQAQQVCPDFRMGGSHLFHFYDVQRPLLGPRRGEGLFEFSRQTRRQHQLSRIVQHTGHYSSRHHRLRRRQPCGDARCQVGLGLELRQGETRDGLAGLHDAEQLDRQHQLLQGIQSQISHRPGNRCDTVWQAEKNRVHQLHQLCRDGHIVLHDSADLAQGNIRVFECRRQQGRSARQSRESSNRAHHPPQCRIRQQTGKSAGSFNGVAQLLGIARLRQILMSHRNRSQGGGGFKVPGEYDADRAGVTLLNQFQQPGSVHGRHPHIGHYRVEGLGFHQGQCLSPTGGKRHVPLMALGTKQALEPCQNHRLVVHKQDALHAVLSSSTRRASGDTASGWPVGTETMNVVPCGRFGSKAILPPCLSTTILRASARPCPVPRPTSLVVKNWSNTRVRIASGMPHPVSLIETVTQSSSSLVFTWILPFTPLTFITVPMACAALTRRLRNTWFKSARWHTTGGRSPKSVSTSATYFNSLRATVRVSSIALFRSAATFSVWPGWANAFIARTMVAIRSTPLNDCSRALGISAPRYSTSAATSVLSQLSRTDCGASPARTARLS